MSNGSNRVQHMVSILLQAEAILASRLEAPQARREFALVH